MTRTVRLLIAVDNDEPLELDSTQVPDGTTLTARGLVKTLRDVADRLEAWRAFCDIVGEGDDVA